VTVVRTIVRWLAILGLAGLAGATLATFLAGFLWLFDLFSHFRLQYVVVAAVLTLMLAWTRPRWASVAALLLGVWHGYIFLSVPTAQADLLCKQQVRVMAFNLLYRNQDMDAAIAAIEAKRPDILVLEENTPNWSSHLERLADDYPYAVPENWRDANGPTVLSHFALSDPRIVRPFETPGLDNGDDRQRFAAGVRYLTVTARIGEQDVAIIAVHPPYPNGGFLTGLRNGYFVSVAELARATDGPVIVAGDFNSTPWSPAFDPLFESGRLAGAGVPLMTWPTWFPLADIPIDHVLVNDRIVVGGVEWGPDLGSDHYLIEATLCMPGGLS